MPAYGSRRSSATVAGTDAGLLADAQVPGYKSESYIATRKTWHLGATGCGRRVRATGLEQRRIRAERAGRESDTGLSSESE
jgi:hypothetical protein